MSYLTLVLIVIGVMGSFLFGFIMGSMFTKAYLRVNGKLLEEPKNGPENHGSGAEK